MNCIQCNAHIAPGSAHCYFCGTLQSPAPAVGVSGTSSIGQPVAAALTSTTPESWRLWFSFFLGGLYAPVASQYLLAREEWASGLGMGSLPPAMPSQRGWVVLSLFAGLPAYLVAVLGLLVNATQVRRSWHAYHSGYTGATGWYGIDHVSSFALMNLFVGFFFLFSWLHARYVERRFELLLAEVSGGDPQRLLAFRRGAVGRQLGAWLCAVPLALLIGVGLIVASVGWFESLDALFFVYALFVGVAAWTSSWLNISPALRFRTVIGLTP